VKTRKVAKNILLFLAKFSLAAIIIWWFYQSGKIDLSLLKQSLQRPITWFWVILLGAFDCCLIAFRWKLLVDLVPNKVKIRSFLKLNWIGQFFSAFMPGAVSGDLIKVFYLRKDEPHFKISFLTGTVLLDRVIGLSTLVLLTLIATAYSYFFRFNKELLGWYGINLLLGLGTGSFWLMILKPRLLNFLSQKLLAPIPLLGKKLEHFFSEIAFIGQHPQVLFKALILSLFITILNFALYWVLLAPNLPETTSMMDVIFLLPIGLISIAIPITPQGLGVGHASFFLLFSAIGDPNGASYFNIIFLFLAVINLLGVFAFLL